MTTDNPETRESLLIAIRDPMDESAWQEFSGLYRPMIFRIARRMGMQPSDSEDVAQQVMLSVADAIKTWSKDPAKGTFRSWLTVVAKNAIRNAITRVPFDRATGGVSVDSGEPACWTENEFDAAIEDEFMRTVFRKAATLVQCEFATTTWKAFWMTSVDGVTVGDASQRLGMSSGAVYAARSRVMRRMQQVAQKLIQDEEIR